MILSPRDLIVDYGRMGMVEEMEGPTSRRPSKRPTYVFRAGIGLPPQSSLELYVNFGSTNSFASSPTTISTIQKTWKTFPQTKKAKTSGSAHETFAAEVVSCVCISSGTLVGVIAISRLESKSARKSTIVHANHTKAMGT
jgi:hypothetical protein